MKRVIIFLIALIPVSLFAQTVNLREVANVPAVIPETSGLEITGRNSLWSHNDSGGQPELYEFDTLGNLLRTITILNASNSDWEELAQDDAGNVYIGDFGNNSSSRQNLKIYKISAPDSIIGDSTQAVAIYFSYEDQTAFPPPASEQNFDMEAMIWYRDSLYLFSKNHTNPFDGYTKRYRLPTAPGTYVAELIDSFYTGPGPYIAWWVTAADISPDHKKLILLSQDKMWLFTCFEGVDFFGGDVLQLSLVPALTQKEAVCFLNNNQIYITDELIAQTIGGKLYRADLSSFYEPDVDLGRDTLVNASSYLLNAGNTGSSFLWSTGDTSQQITISTSGMYWVEVTTSNGCKTADTIEVTLSPSNSINDITQPFEVKVAPNPFSDFTEITIDQVQDPGNIIIYDLYGQEILEEKLDPGFNRVRFQSDVESDIYFVRVLSGGGATVQILLKDN